MLSIANLALLIRVWLLELPCSRNRWSDCNHVCGPNLDNPLSIKYFEFNQFSIYYGEKE